MFFPGSNDVVQKEYKDGPTLIMPVSLLIALHNSTPSGHPVRREIQDYLRAFGARNDKAHWSRGLVVLDNGDLRLDDRFRNVAVHRGKQETYIESAEKAFEQLRFALNQVADYQQEELLSSIALAAADIPGTPLVPIRDLSEAAMKLQARSKELGSLVHAMRDGLTESLTHHSGPAAALLHADDLAKDGSH